MKRSEHWKKYDALAEKLGRAELLALVPLKLETIRKMLDDGDEYLNGKGLAPWDRAALGPPRKATNCPTCGQRRLPEMVGGKDWPQNVLRRTARDRGLPWRLAPTLSLTSRVCVLKHVAREAALELVP